MNHFLIFYSLLFYAFTIKATPLKQQNIINPNEVRHYISKEAVEELESSIKIDTDLSKVTFYLYTPENGVDDPWEFKAGINPNELLIRNFDPKRQTKFIAHGWTVNGNFSRPFAEGIKIYFPFLFYLAECPSCSSVLMRPPEQTDWKFEMSLIFSIMEKSILC